ncbi:hypothetical protein CHS0354_005803 [Potamilus streckersoni]|uniref:Uncharacterized protein n=1 Tax=Potamilus streckersoni TaxID=2493646 RepID=A0AAE0SUK8_9BIVA|nr:hypothetical protein CHS0354_005803 [Potamilus streckersoni]
MDKTMVSVKIYGQNYGVFYRSMDKTMVSVTDQLHYGQVKQLLENIYNILLDNQEARFEFGNLENEFWVGNQQEKQIDNCIIERHILPPVPPTVANSYEKDLEENILVLDHRYENVAQSKNNMATFQSNS